MRSQRPHHLMWAWDHSQFLVMTVLHTTPHPYSASQMLPVVGIKVFRGGKLEVPRVLAVFRIRYCCSYCEFHTASIYSQYVGVLYCCGYCPYLKYFGVRYCGLFPYILAVFRAGLRTLPVLAVLRPLVLLMITAQHH